MTIKEKLDIVLDTKKKIKQAINTNSDKFNEYPDIIKSRISGVQETDDYAAKEAKYLQIIEENDIVAKLVESIEIVDDNLAHLYYYIPSSVGDTVEISNIRSSASSSTSLANIDWGDGSARENIRYSSVDSSTAFTHTHTYETGGLKHVVIRGTWSNPSTILSGSTTYYYPICPTSSIRNKYLIAMQIGKFSLMQAAFAFGVKNLRRVIFSYPNVIIPAYGFQGCSMLKTMEVSDKENYSIIRINADGLNSSGLKTLDFIGGNTVIDQRGCYGLALDKLVLDGDISRFALQAFQKCTIKELVLPKAVQDVALSSQIFAQTQIDKLIFEEGIASMKSVNNNQFTGAQIKEVINAPSICTGESSSISGNTTVSGMVTYDDSCTTINAYNIWSVPAPKIIKLGKKIETIKASAWASGSWVVDCRRCLKVPTLGNSGLITQTKMILVPNDLLEEWKVATNWAMYAGIIVGIDREE